MTSGWSSTLVGLGSWLDVWQQSLGQLPLMRRKSLLTTPLYALAPTADVNGGRGAPAEHPVGLRGPSLKEEDMQVDEAAMIAQGIGSDHPIFENVNIERLTGALGAYVRSMIERDDLPYYTSSNGDRWTTRTVLPQEVGFGIRLFDPASPYFLPPEAVVNVVYLQEPITAEVAAASPYQRRALTSASIMADYLRDLRGEFQLRAFDIRVSSRTSDVVPIRRLLEADAITMYPEACGWWISSTELKPFIPSKNDLYDPASAWYVDPYGWADHNVIDNLTAEHRQNWPEIYNTFSD